MKFKIFCSLLSLCLIVSMLCLPWAVRGLIPTADYVFLQYQSYEKTVKATGSICSNGEYEIYLQTPVIAKDVLVRIGDSVSAGQPLFQVDRELTQAVLAGSDATSYPSSIPADLSEAELQRYAELYNLTTHQVQQFMEDELKQQAKAATEAQVPNTVYAPASGVVTQLSVAKNVMTDVGKALITLSDPEKYVAVLQINEKDIAQLALGNRVRITGEAFPNQTYFGTVTNIYPSAHTVTGALTQETVVDVEVSFENANSALKSGFTVSAEVLTQEPRELLTLAYEAIRQDEENREYVYVYRDGKAQKQYITTGVEMTYGAEIVDGLQAGDIVLVTENVEDQHKVKLGSEVLVEGLY